MLETLSAMQTNPVPELPAAPPPATSPDEAGVLEGTGSTEAPPESSSPKGNSSEDDNTAAIVGGSIAVALYCCGSHVPGSHTPYHLFQAA